MVILKTGSYCFYIRIGSHSRGTCPLLGEGLRHAAGGGTSNQEHGTLLHNKSWWQHCRDGQLRGRHLQYKASFDRAQVAILAADWLQTEPVKNPCGCASRGQSLPKIARRVGMMVSKHISDGKVLWQFLGTCIKMFTCHIFYFCFPRHFLPPQRPAPFNGHPRHMRTQLDSIFHAYYLIKTAFLKKYLSWYHEFGSCKIKLAKIHFSPCCSILGFADAE